MTLVIDLDKVCLVCLMDGGRWMVPIDKCDEYTPHLTIIEKMSHCSSVWADLQTTDTKLPDKICNHCVDDLDACWRFRQHCENADTIYRNISEQELQHLETELKIMETEAPSSSKPEKTPFKRSVEVVAETNEQEEMLEENDFFLMPVEELVVGESEQEDTIEEVPDSANELDSEDLASEYQESTTECEIASNAAKRTKPEESTKFNTSNATNAANRTKPEESTKFNTSSNKAYEEFLSSKKHHAAMRKRGPGRPRKTEQAEKKDEDDQDFIPNVGYLKNRTAPSKTKAKTNCPAKANQSPAHGSPAKRGGPRDRSSDPKICEICGNTYKYQHALAAHMRRHTNDRPFTCEFCSKAFVANVELKRHMRVHTGHRPYSCSFCERKFADFGSWRKHERTHTGERPYVCTTCGKAFAYAHVLSIHMRTHTGEKAFKCQLCSRGFTKKVYLESHLQWHANEERQVGGDFAMPASEDQEDGDSYGDMKTVALEECIFTTEMVDSGDGEAVACKDEKDNEDIYEIYTLNEQLNEHHLPDDEENSYAIVSG